MVDKEPDRTDMIFKLFGNGKSTVSTPLSMRADGAL